LSKKKSPAFQFYPDSWLSSTDIQLMTPAEEGAFIRLLCHAWLQPDGGLPDDDSALAILSRLGSAWRKSAERLRRKFVARDGRLFNERLSEERCKQEEWSRKSKAGGNKSAETRWGPNGKGGYEMLTVSPQPNGNSSSSSPSSSSVPTDVGTKAPPPESPKPLTIMERETGFEEFFELWSERGKDLASDQDWADFRRFEWGPAGFARQQECLAGARACPGPWLGTPRSWMRNRGWQRVANPNAPSPQRRQQRVDVLALGRKLQAEEDAKKGLA
jgi:uncharacterized protein YdaU (DUF1376 family)